MNPNMAVASLESGASSFYEEIAMRSQAEAGWVHDDSDMAHSPRQNDANGNPTSEQDGFSAAFESLDRNQDGVVSRSEWRGAFSPASHSSQRGARNTSDRSAHATDLSMSMSDQRVFDGHLNRFMCHNRAALQRNAPQIAVQEHHPPTGAGFMRRSESPALSSIESQSEEEKDSEGDVDVDGATRASSPDLASVSFRLSNPESTKQELSHPKWRLRSGSIR